MLQKNVDHRNAWQQHGKNGDSPDGDASRIVFERLQKVPALEGLATDALEDLAHLGKLETFSPGCLGELHGAVEAILIGQGEGWISQLFGAEDEFLDMGGAVQERKRRVGVEFDVGRSSHKLMVFEVSSIVKTEDNPNKRNAQSDTNRAA